MGEYLISKNKEYKTKSFNDLYIDDLLWADKEFNDSIENIILKYHISTNIENHFEITDEELITVESEINDENHILIRIFLQYLIASSSKYLEGNLFEEFKNFIELYFQNIESVDGGLPIHNLVTIIKWTLHKFPRYKKEIRHILFTYTINGNNGVIQYFLLTDYIIKDSKLVNIFTPKQYEEIYEKYFVTTTDDKHIYLYLEIYKNYLKYIKDYNKLIKKDFLKKYCDFVIKNIELIDSHTKQILLQKIRDYMDEWNIYGDSDYYIIDSSLEKANKESLKSMQSVEINLSEEFVKEMEEKINFFKKIYLKLDCNERIQKLLSELSPINIIETKKYIEESKGAFASAFKEHIVDSDGKVINYNDLDETQMLSLKANEYINIMMRLYFACIIRPFYSSPINEDEVKKSIYNILTNSKLVSSDRIDSLLDSFVALLKQDFKASIYDIVEEFEESLRYYFKNEKMNIYKRNAKRDLIGLSNIFNDHKINTYRDRLYETIDENYYFTLKWFLVDNYGFGLKNKISHRYKAKDLYNTTYAIYSAFQILRFYWGFQNN